MTFKSRPVEFTVLGPYALFTDPITKASGEKCSYPVPTYEAVRGILRSIYWKPTFLWVVDKIRVMNPIRMHARGMKPRKSNFTDNDLAVYTYLVDVEYQVQAHMEWNPDRPDLEGDRNEPKHYESALRMIRRGGRFDVFLGTRDCCGYVVPSSFGERTGYYDGTGKKEFGLMLYGFGYPNETGEPQLTSRWWHAEMTDGVITFPKPNDTSLLSTYVIR